jgi:hypothetical protein
VLQLVDLVNVLVVLVVAFEIGHQKLWKRYFPQIDKLLYICFVGTLYSIFDMFIP